MKEPTINAPGPIRELLDDFARMPEGKRTLVAGSVAVLFHAAIFIGGGAIIFRMQKHTEVKPVEKKSQLEVTLFTPTPEPKPSGANATPAPKKENEKLTEAEEKQLAAMFEQLPEETRRELVDVDNLAKQKNLSKRALLESWADSVAGSRLRGKGDAPAPTREGGDYAFMNYRDEQGPKGNPSSREDSQGSEQSPIFKPQPIKKQEITQPFQRVVPKVAEVAKQKSKEDIQAPTPPPSRLVLAAATPPPIKNVREASADEIPMFINQPEKKVQPDVTLRPEPTPEPAPEIPKLKPTPVPTTNPKQVPMDEKSTIIARLPSDNRPKPVVNPGYEPQTKIEGGNLPTGENGVDAVSTVRGKYRKGLSVTIDTRWNHYIHLTENRGKFTEGLTVFVVTLDARGKILQVKLTDNTSNAAHAEICERAIRESQRDIDPPPPEVLSNGVYIFPQGFTLY